MDGAVFKRPYLQFEYHICLFLSILFLIRELSFIEEQHALSKEICWNDNKILVVWREWTISSHCFVISAICCVLVDFCFALRGRHGQTFRRPPLGPTLRFFFFHDIANRISELLSLSSTKMKSQIEFRTGWEKGQCGRTWPDGLFRGEKSGAVAQHFDIILSTASRPATLSYSTIDAHQYRPTWHHPQSPSMAVRIWNLLCVSFTHDDLYVLL